MECESFFDKQLYIEFDLHWSELFPSEPTILGLVLLALVPGLLTAQNVNILNPNPNLGTLYVAWLHSILVD